MIGAFGVVVRVFRLGLALARLEAAERAGAAVCLHSSFCADPGSGWWIAVVRPEGWKSGPLGRPVVGQDLVDVLQRAEERARSKRPARCEP
jgi:hypothetical protein